MYIHVNVQCTTLVSGSYYMELLSLAEPLDLGASLKEFVFLQPLYIALYMNFSINVGKIGYVGLRDNKVSCFNCQLVASTLKK